MELIKLQILFLVIHASMLSSWSQPSEMYISTGNEIIQLQASTGDHLATRVLFNGLEEAENLDVDRYHNFVYWVDTVLRTINRASVLDHNTILTNNYETLISNDIQMPSCVAVDWIAGNIFFTDVMRQRIEVATVNGLYRKVLIHQNLTAPTGIAVDVYSGHMFWIDNSSNPIIERASFDGSNRVVIISDGLVNPHTLAVDYNSNGVPLLFWINTINGYRVIEYSFVNGSGRTRLKEWDSNSYPSSLSVSGDDIFWTSNSRDGTIQQFNKATNSTKTFFYQTNKTVCDLNTPQVVNFTSTVTSPCAQNICQQICLTMPPGNVHKCTCSTGLKLRSDNRNCQIYPNKVLFTSHDDGIRYVSLDIEDEFVDVSLPINPAFTKNVNKVTFGIGSMIYWSETATELNQTSSSAIRRSSLNGSNVETLIRSSLHTPSGLVIDNAAGNLYWIDRHLKRIEVSRLNGSARKVLISSDLTDPHSLAIDRSSRALLYWSDWGNNDSIPARIERAYFDGSDRRTIVTFDTGIVPLGIFVDISNSILYWAASNGTIGRCNSRGRRSRIIYNGTTVKNTDGITIVDDYIYWIDKTAGNIWKASKDDASDARVALKGLTHLRGISSADMVADSSGGDCQFDNNHCSHLCLGNGSGARCDCPTGLILDSYGKRCTEAENLLAYSRPDGITLARLGCHSIFREKLNVTMGTSMDAIDVEVQANRTYWIDKVEKKIYRANNFGEYYTEVVVASGLEEPYDLAVDWMGGNLYWTDWLGGKIEVSKLDGSYRRVLYTGLRNPSLIEVNPLLGVLYVVTHWDKVEQYWMDGQGDAIRTFDEFEDYTIEAMTIDYENDHLYFRVDGGQPYALSRCNSDFSNLRRAILDFRPNNFVYGHPLPPFAVHNGLIYIIIEDRGLLTFYTGGSTGIRCFNSLLNTPVYSTEVIHHGRQPGSHWCQVDNGNCEGLCLPQKFGRVCKCLPHQQYDSALNECKDVNDFIVFSNTTGIYQVPLTENSHSFMPQMLPLGQGEINGVAYDNFTDQLYWVQTLQPPGSDISTYSGSVRRGKLSGSDQVVIQEVNLINTRWFDVHLDPAGGHIFWTLTGGNQIELVNTNGQGLAPMLSHEHLNPRSLAFNLEESILYFVNWWGTTLFSSIQQLQLRTRETKTVYEEKEMIVGNITITNREKQGSLFYDSDSHRLYWSDSKLNAVLSCSVESLPCNNPVTVLRVDFHNNLAFVIDGEFIYWYNSTQQAIYRANKYDGSSPSIFATGIVELNDFTIGHRRNGLTRTVCTAEPHPCSHLCIPKGSRFECACPHNYFMSSDYPNTCEMSGCKENEQSCLDNSGCVNSQYVCDRHSDCPDGSDESSEFCSCQIYHFTCNNGDCVPLDVICDGKENCNDGSDEAACGCPEGYAMCPTGTRAHHCIPQSWFCDGESDCNFIINGTSYDEINCGYPVTLPTSPPPRDVPTIISVYQGNNSYPAGHTVIIVVCAIIGGLITVFLAFLVLTVCYFSNSKKSWGHYKFSTSTPDTSSRLSTGSETTPNSVCSLPTRSTNVLDGSDGISYDGYPKNHPHSVSELSVETREAYHYQPPNTPTTNKSVHFGGDNVTYRSQAESALTFNDDTSYVGPCPSVTGMGDDISYITSVSEVARRRQQQEIMEYRQQTQQYYTDTEYDTTSITSADTKITYNSTNFIEPPPPSLVSQSLYMDEQPDNY